MKLAVSLAVATTVIAPELAVVMDLPLATMMLSTTLAAPQVSTGFLRFGSPMTCECPAFTAIPCTPLSCECPVFTAIPCTYQQVKVALTQSAKRFPSGF